ncbi:hypothetical protein C8R46DRAFT_1035886 [Mycena filopes]|nr:hypothetical protein C8R46DRAFT_1035886 [Mycena filopes]
MSDDTYRASSPVHGSVSSHSSRPIKQRRLPEESVKVEEMSPTLRAAHLTAEGEFTTGNFFAPGGALNTQTGDGSYIENIISAHQASDDDDYPNFVRSDDWQCGSRNFVPAFSPQFQTAQPMDSYTEPEEDFSQENSQNDDVLFEADLELDVQVQKLQAKLEELLTQRDHAVQERDEYQQALRCSKQERKAAVESLRRPLWRRLNSLI